MCPSCIVEHSGHQFIKLDMSTGVLKAKLLKAEEKADSLEKSLDKAGDELDRQMTQTQKSEKEQISLVERQLDNLIKLVMEHGQTLTNQIKLNASHSKAKLQEGRDKITEAKDSLEKHQDEVKALKEGLDNEDTLDHQTAKGRLETLDKELLVAQEKNGQLEREVNNQGK